MVAKRERVGKDSHSSNAISICGPITNPDQPASWDPDFCCCCCCCLELIESIWPLAIYRHPPPTPQTTTQPLDADCSAQLWFRWYVVYILYATLLSWPQQLCSQDLILSGLIANTQSQSQSMQPQSSHPARHLVVWSDVVCPVATE